LAKDLGIEPNVLVVVIILGQRAARVPGQCQGQREGRGAGDAPRALRSSVPHSYPLQMTAKCAVSPAVIVVMIGALLRHPCGSGPRQTGRPRRRRWLRRRG